ncbi:unnamed protein product [Candidula unifasciata]|uniref:PiggyBac transposable element-derived protein domain-containing protein n=1 Tax=Candidula unifasciata TaxID=100452 RepID=A0A8S3Z539_9EUPU|nr:unnamed protein product [Candidula unifasciata]
MEYGIVKRGLEMYFRRTGFLFDTPGYRAVFTRDRFLAIWKFIHYVDDRNPLADKTDKLYNVRPLLDQLIDKFHTYYVPHQQMSLDEGMIPAKNRTAMKHCIQSKPVKWGIKSFLLCESQTGYIYNIEVYTGKTAGQLVPQLCATGNLVMKLTSCIAGQNYQLFMDGFYNSPDLSRHLLKMNIETCGPVQVNRKDFPRQLIRQQKEMKRGDYDYLSCSGVTVVVWCDRAPLYFITTFHNLSVVTFVNRRNKDGSVVQVSCPQVVTDYTKEIGGCDRNDQLTKLCRSRKRYRWPRRLIMNCILWSCYNAYVIRGHFKPHKTQGKRQNTFYDFVDELCMSLIGDVRSPAVQRQRSVQGSVETRLLNVGDHHPERPDEATGNNRCAVCREKAKRFQLANPRAVPKGNPFKKSRTAFRCSSCLTYLCIRQGSSCWRDYHTKTEYWS